MTRFIRIWVLALCLLTLPLAWSASAQTGADPTDRGNAARTTSERGDRDWGWIGLLGLIGLAGLLRRREEPARHRVNEPTTSR